MKLSKIICGAVAAVMTLSLAGCGGEKSGISLAKEGSLVMATNAEFPPYEYREGGDIVGIDIEIAQAIADDMGLKLEIEDMQFDSINVAVQSGKADIGIAGMTVDETRLQIVDFSIPYVNTTQVVIIKETSAVASLTDLEGKKIAVQLGTTGDTEVASKIEGATVERYNKGFEAVQALTQDKVDAVIIDREPAKVFVSQNEGLKILDEEYTGEEYAIAIAKGNQELLEQVNATLTNLKDSGKLQEIIDKYISAE
ncbi:MAG: basic amino acid ABC transporter substrate-binding protein [Ruminococcus sp.]|nr:basic amino acid ABC transporter substrate-binding protein [Ruminococcus sp.]MCM1381448.1 basic amino acid ABC transporter substrate-binding protein [Muribaculaceae bacterium]MCM1479267.1 basic amino acid ABC transporter substrate-binding protein [Muribaculaceae bacterium]